jgi:hypothetical protein
MKLVLKSVDGNYKFYWVTIRKNSIHGWFSGDWLRQELKLPDNIHFDSHFTFPQDGDFHYSYKSINSKVEEYINVYWNRVTIKTIENGLTTKTVQSREDFEANILGHLAPRFRADPFNIVKQFHFVNVSFNIFNGGFKISKRGDLLIADNEIESTDLVIDVSQMDNRLLNISAGIQPVETISTAQEPSKIFCKYLPMPNSRHLELRCRIN